MVYTFNTCLSLMIDIPVILISILKIILKGSFLKDCVVGNCKLKYSVFYEFNLIILKLLSFLNKVCSCCAAIQIKREFS